MELQPGDGAVAKPPVRPSPYAAYPTSGGPADLVTTRGQIQVGESTGTTVISNGAGDVTVDRAADGLRVTAEQGAVVVGEMAHGLAELACRPGGVLAAKIHLKHVAVATTEGYAEGRELPQTGEKPQVGRSLRCRSEGRSRGDRPHVTERFSRRGSPAETPSHHN